MKWKRFKDNSFKIPTAEANLSNQSMIQLYTHKMTHTDTVKQIIDNSHPK